MGTTATKSRLLEALAVNARIILRDFPKPNKLAGVALNWDHAAEPVSGTSFKDGEELQAILLSDVQVTDLLAQLAGQGNRLVLIKRAHAKGGSAYFEISCSPAYEGQSDAEIPLEAGEELINKYGTRDYCVTGFLNPRDQGEELCLNIWYRRPDWVVNAYPDGLKHGQVKVQPEAIAFDILPA